MDSLPSMDREMVSERAQIGTESASAPCSTAGSPDRQFSTPGAARLGENCFAMGGEAARILQGIDWEERPVGPVGEWPHSLRTALNICLSSRYPICILWGPERTYFYNDAYTPIVGDKHPQALGDLYPNVWPEIWEPVIKPILEEVERTGQASWCDNILLVLRRYGFNEECYFAFSFAPVRLEDGAVGGVFTAITETTRQIVGERRLRTLKDLATRAPEAKSADEACRVAAEVLAGNPHDVPFSLFYLTDPDGSRARLAAALGTNGNVSISPAEISLGVGGPGEPWPFSEAIRAGRPIALRGIGERFGPLPGGPWEEEAHTAVVVPIARPGQAMPYGFFVGGVSPRRALDADYESFLSLVASQVATAISNARAHEEERRRAEALAELDRAKTAFFSNVSHEFRTPLTLMIGPLEEMLAESGEQVPPAFGEKLRLAHRNSLRLLKLVNTLLDFSRIEAGRAKARFEPTDLGPLTEELAGVFRSAIEKAGLRLKVSCPPLSQPASVDREMWEKIVLNLLSNAFKYTLEGEIEVSLREAQGRAQLAVRDTGAGIPRHELKNVFKRFHRVEGAQGRTFEGTGIGLALVQELVKLHGGEIGVESEEGRGSVFTVSLPLGAGPDQAEPNRGGPGRLETVSRSDIFVNEALGWGPERPEAWLPSDSESPLRERSSPAGPGFSPAPGRRSRVLLADDNSDMREYARRLLAPRFDLVLAADGEAALEQIRRHKPDLVVTDVMMPRCNGFELLKQLRAEASTRDLPVIMLSARAGEESTIEGLEAGADDYLVKPFSGRELLTRVQTRLDLARARAEAASGIAQAHARLRAALNAARMVSWEYDLSSGRCLRDGDFLREIGLQGEALEDFLNLVYPEDLGKVRQAIAEAARGDSEYNLEFRLQTRAGRLFWVHDCAHLGRDQLGQPSRLSGLMVDISPLKQVESRLGAVLSSIDDHLVSYDRQWRFTYVNERGAQVLGFRPEELLGRCIWELFPKAAGNPYYQDCHRALEEQRIVRSEFYYEPFEKWFENHIYPSAEGVTVFSADITARKKAEQAVRDRELRFQLVSRATNDVIWDWDFAANTVAWNEAAGLSFGYAPEELGESAEGWSGRIHPEERDRVMRGLRAAIDGNAETWQDEYRFLCKDGSYRVFLDRGFIARDGQGKPLRMIGSMLDVTEKRQASERLEAAVAERTQKLRETIAELEAFSYSISHDMRGPLRAMQGYAKVLLEEDASRLGPLQQAYLSRIARAAQRLDRLILDVLDYSRLARTEFAPQPVDLERLIEEVLQQYPALREPGAQIRVESPLAPVLGHEVLLTQCLSNLLGNAVKFVKPGGAAEVRVRTERVGKQVKVWVEDNGIGIDPQNHARVFGIFQRLNPDSTYEGTGIGLAIVKKAVERMGGQAGVDSRLGEGSRFWIQLESPAA